MLSEAEQCRQVIQAIDFAIWDGALMGGTNLCIYTGHWKLIYSMLDSECKVSSVDIDCLFESPFSKSPIIRSTEGRLLNPSEPIVFSSIGTDDYRSQRYHLSPLDFERYSPVSAARVYPPTTKAPACSSVLALIHSFSPSLSKITDATRDFCVLIMDRFPCSSEAKAAIHDHEAHAIPTGVDSNYLVFWPLSRAYPLRGERVLAKGVESVLLKLGLRRVLGGIAL